MWKNILTTLWLLISTVSNHNLISAQIVVQETNDFVYVSTTKFSRVKIEKNTGIIKDIQLRELDAKNIDHNLLAKNYYSGFSSNTMDKFTTVIQHTDQAGNRLITLSDTAKNFSTTFKFVDNALFITVVNNSFKKNVGDTSESKITFQQSMDILNVKEVKCDSSETRINNFIKKWLSRIGRTDSVDSRLRTLNSNLKGLAISSKYFFHYIGALNNTKFITSSSAIANIMNGTRVSKSFSLENSSLNSLSPCKITSVIYCGTKRSTDLKGIADLGIETKKAIKGIAFDAGILGWAQKICRFMLRVLYSLFRNIVIAAIVLGILFRLVILITSALLTNNQASRDLSNLNALKEQRIIDDASYARRQKQIVEKNKFSLAFLPLALVIVVLNLCLMISFFILANNDPLFYLESFLWIKDVSRADTYFVLPVIGLIMQLISIQEIKGAFKYVAFGITLLYFPTIPSIVTIQLIIGTIISEVSKIFKKPLETNIIESKPC